MIKKIILISILLSFAYSLISFPTNQNRNKKKQEFRIFKKIIETQRTIYRNMMGKIRDYKKNKTPKLLLLFLSITLLYGVVHVLGPGHGKIISSTFLISDNPSYRQGIILGLGVGGFHAISGLILTGALFLIFRTGFAGKATQISVFMQLASYSILILLGIFMLFKNFKNDENQHIHNHKNLKLFILSAGLIPCPGAIMISIFSMNHKIFLEGIFMIFSMAIGMGLSLTLINLSIVASQKKVAYFFLNRVKYYDKILVSIKIIGSIVLIIFGFIMFIGAFRNLGVVAK